MVAKRRKMNFLSKGEHDSVGPVICKSSLWSLSTNPLPFCHWFTDSKSSITLICNCLGTYYKWLWRWCEARVYYENTVLWARRPTPLCSLVVFSVTPTNAVIFPFRIGAACSFGWGWSPLGLRQLKPGSFQSPVWANKTQICWWVKRKSMLWVKIIQESIFSTVLWSIEITLSLFLSSLPGKPIALIAVIWAS